MDRETLVEHRDRWGREPTPTVVRLDRLRPPKAALSRDRVFDSLGTAVRLEQRIDWSWAQERLPYE